MVITLEVHCKNMVEYMVKKK